MRLDQAFNPSDALPGADPDQAAAQPAPATKKKSIDPSIAGLLLMMVVAAGGLYAMHLRTRPATTDEGELAAVGPAEAKVNSFMEGGEQQLANIDRALRETNRLMESLRVKPAARTASAVLTGPDPFFQLPNVAPQGEPADDEMSNAGVSREQRELARLQAAELARKLRLQSILHGSARRACLINDKLCFEGGPAGEGFVVERITRDEVVVRRGEHGFKLRMGR